MEVGWRTMLARTVYSNQGKRTVDTGGGEKELQWIKAPATKTDDLFSSGDLLSGRLGLTPTTSPLSSTLMGHSTHKINK